MKTFFPILFLVFLFLSSSLHAQTLTGPVKIDSTLHVVDSVYIEKNMMIEQDVKVKGEGIFTQQLKAKSDLKVLGTTKMTGDAFVNGTFKFKGLADQLATDDRLLIINANGKTDAIAKSGLQSSLYSIDCVALQQQGGGGGNTVLAPAWQSSPGNNAGYLFTGVTCPANVGIGIAAPETRLDVRGSGHFQTSLGVGALPILDAQLYVESNLEVAVEINHTAQNNTGYGLKSNVDNADTKGIAVFNSTYGLNGADVFRVYGDGLVQAKRIKVTSHTWSDFVFDDDYQLLPLSAVETFIHTNNHLPDVPSESTIVAEGIDLGEMDAILLQKIEELTLYMIALNKEVQTLQAENEALKTQLNKSK